MWSRGYDHFVMRQAKEGISYGPGALWLAVSAESRGQVDQVFAELRDAGAEILQPPKELDYFAPGYYSVAFRDPDGVPIEVAHRWDELPEVADAEQVQVPGHGVTLGGYFFKPQAGTPPYPAVILLHGFAGHAHNMVGLARTCTANGYAALALVAARLAGVRGREATRACASRSTCWRRSTGSPSGRWSTRSASPWSAPRWAARWRCWRRRTSRRSAPSPPSTAPTDLARWREANPFIRDYLDDLCGPEGLPVRSPILRVAQIDAPVLLVHGDRDENVPVEQAQAMAEALKSHGKEVETFIVPGGTHFFTEQQNAQTRRKLFDFLRRHLNRS